jgi:hypothetical protein
MNCFAVLRGLASDVSIFDAQGIVALAVFE